VTQLCRVPLPGHFSKGGIPRSRPRSERKTRVSFPVSSPPIAEIEIRRSMKLARVWLFDVRRRKRLSSHLPGRCESCERSETMGQGLGLRFNGSTAGWATFAKSQRSVVQRTKQVQKNESVPDSSSRGTPVEQPSPEVCSPPRYVLICALGMARMGYCGNLCHPCQEISGLVFYGGVARPFN
jgi:hypothetical protein